MPGAPGTLIIPLNTLDTDKHTHRDTCCDSPIPNPTCSSEALKPCSVHVLEPNLNVLAGLLV